VKHALVIPVAFISIICGVAAVGAGELTQAPELVLKDPKGAPFKLEYKSSKLTLVNFWAVWCVPCREEMPQIAKLAEKYGPMGFRSIGIAMESGGVAEVKSFLDENRSLGINYPILVGDDVAAEKFGDIQVVPTTYLIDSNGKIVAKYLGVTTNFLNQVGGQIRKYLSEHEQDKQPAAKETPAAGKP
jgi:thiol-disulfide isomerase/thioredoxin